MDLKTYVNRMVYHVCNYTELEVKNEKGKVYNLHCFDRQNVYYYNEKGKKVIIRNIRTWLKNKTCNFMI